MPTTPCPACGSPTEYENGAATVGCPTAKCRVSEFHTTPRAAERRIGGAA